MINLHGKNVLCKSEKEFLDVLKISEEQNFNYCNGIPLSYPCVLCFDSNENFATYTPLKEGNIKIDAMAYELINYNGEQEMTAREFLENFIDLTRNKCPNNCMICKFKNNKCNSDGWTIDDIDDLIDVVSSETLDDRTEEQKEMDKSRWIILDYMRHNVLESDVKNALKVAINKLDWRKM